MRSFEAFASTTLAQPAPLPKWTIGPDGQWVRADFILTRTDKGLSDRPVEQSK